MEDVYVNIDFNSDSYIDLLKGLIAIPSISATNEGIDECTSLLLEIMEDIGLSTKVIPVEGGNPIIYGELSSTTSKKTILFYNHYDVNPAEPIDQWNSPPFQLRVRIEGGKGRIFGRGVADNKGDTVSRLAAIKAFLDTHGDIPINIKFLIEGEEQIGSPHLSDFVRRSKRLLKADYGIWEYGSNTPDGRPWVILGLKGLQHIDLHCKGPTRPVHSSRAPIITSPIWRLTQALSSLIDDAGNIIIEGFHEPVKKPSKKELESIRKIPFKTSMVKQYYGIKKLKKGVTNSNLVKTLKFQPTCNISGIQSGYIGPADKTIIPANAYAKLDFRLVDGQTPYKVFQQVKKHLKSQGFNDILVIDRGGVPPSRTPFNDPFVKKIAKASKKVYKKAPLLDPLGESSGPLHIFRKTLKIPFIGVGVGQPFSMTNAPNENITVDNFIDTIKFMSTILNISG